MRLRTHMVNLTNQNEDAFMGSYSQDDVAHDAMAAHALVMAIGELQSMSEMLVTIRLRKRADELMSEWGFRED